MSASPQVQDVRPAAHFQERLSFFGLRALQSFCFTVVVALFFITFVVQAFQIPSRSMENTLLVGDYLLVDKAIYGMPSALGALLPHHEPARGDVVVFHYPVRPEMYFVKRVAAVPGDRVRIAGKRLYVNGLPAPDPAAIHLDAGYDPYRDNFPQPSYAAPVDPAWWREMRRLTNARGELVVPAGHYFVLGDNRDDSQDSRYWGLVPRENMVGRPVVIYWSLRTDHPGPAVTAARGDTLSGLAYAVKHFREYTRWDRTLRVVR